jgi:hypothetical protein
VDGSLMNTHSGSWTSGFYPGILWQLHDYKNNSKLKEAAEGWVKYLEKEKLDKKTHDLAFKIYCSFGTRLPKMKIIRPLYFRQQKH